MKSIFDQYKALSEGTLGQAQFLRNVKMTLPKFVSNTTSFSDAVKILKSKGIISEAKADDYAHYCNPQEYDLGMRYELDKGTDEDKASKIVYKNLADNAAYYSQLHLAGYNEDAMKKDRKKRTDLPIEVKKDNFIDAANGVKKVKMDKLTEEEMIVLVGNVLNEVINNKLDLSEALNKDIKEFGQDVERNLKSAGFSTLVTFQTPTDEQTNQVANDPKLVILYVSQDSSSQGLQLRGNIAAVKDLSKIVNKFQLSSWNGPKKEFGSGWDAKTKQVVGGFNPGDIVGVKDPDTGISGKKFYDAGFYRFAKVDTTVRTNESLAEVADQKKTNLNESIEDNIAQIVNDKSSKYTFYNDKHKADMQRIFRMSAIKQILKNPNLTDEDKTKLETELEANKPEIKPTTQVSYPDSLADLIRQSSLD